MATQVASSWGLPDPGSSPRPPISAVPSPAGQPQPQREEGRGYYDAEAAATAAEHPTGGGGHHQHRGSSSGLGSGSPLSLEFPRGLTRQMSRLKEPQLERRPTM